MHQNMLFCNKFHFSCKNTKGYILRRGMKKVNKNIFFIYCPCC